MPHHPIGSTFHSPPFDRYSVVYSGEIVRPGDFGLNESGLYPKYGTESAFGFATSTGLRVVA